jgi:predicted dehydrogenase
VGNDRVRIGVVGLGHWFQRLAVGLSGSEIAITKAVGKKPYLERKAQLNALGIAESNYYISLPDGSIPDAFFEDIDVVYISSPNKFHYTQAVQALNNGKFAIIEKTLATNEDDFNKIIDFIVKNGHQRKTYLHLHYLHKQLTLKMDAILSRLVNQYGKVQKVSATFVESCNEEDKHRLWVLSMEEGGIFMDWIHPFEILFYGAMADSVKLSDADMLIINREYSDEDPSAVDAMAKANGKYFEKDADVSIKVGKGAKEDMKCVRFCFKDDVFAEFNYIHSYLEFGSQNRGSWRLVNNKDDKMEILESESPTGPNTSEIFAKEIVAFCDGEKVGMPIGEIRRLFQPQWDFQRLMEGKRPTLVPLVPFAGREQRF